MKKKVVAITTIALLSSTFGTSAFASTYQVQKGDTLTKIAKKYNTSVPQLKSLNSLHSDLIYINQTLKVDTSASSSTISPPATSTNKPSNQTVETIVTKPSQSTTTTYIVVKGDTLGKIANQHSISLTNLMKWNNLDHHIIYPGQILKVSTTATMVDTSKPGKDNQTKPPQTSNASEYVVQKGDTLSHISVKVSMTIAELKQLNSLSSDLIFVGQKLKVKGNIPPGKETNNSKEPVESLDNAIIDSLISQAKSWIGIPYVWGGSTLNGFDCSGFIYYAFNAVGTKISRLSTDGYYSRSYYVDSPKTGDLVFFENTYRPGISHMGIYLGNNEFIHASSSKGVMISNLNDAYFKPRFDGFKRFY